MRHYSKTLFLCAALCLAGCASPVPSERGTVQVRVSLPATKGEAPSPAERAIDRLDLFAFDADGHLESSWSMTEADADGVLEATLILTRGSKSFYAVANAPAALEKAVGSLDDLRTAVSRFTDNAPGRLVMTGSAAAEVPTDKPVPVSLAHIAARIEVGRITRAFTAPGLQDAAFTVTGISLMEVPATAPYFPERSGEQDGVHYNTCGTEAPGNPLSSLLTETVRPQPVSPGQSADFSGHPLYAYPNPAPEAGSDTETDRVTKVLVSTLLDGKPRFYALGLPGLARNRSYHISELVLTRPGTDIPGAYVSAEDLSFTLTAAPWRLGDPAPTGLSGTDGDYTL